MDSSAAAAAAVSVICCITRSSYNKSHTSKTIDRNSIGATLNPRAMWDCNLNELKSY